MTAVAGTAPQKDPELRRYNDKLASRRVDELRPHPSYVRNHLAVPASKLSALAELGDLAFQEPLLITPDGTIIDGYGRWELARQRGRQTLECIECELTQEEALRWLVQRHRPSNGLNAFLRILLALDLELRLKDKARSNERAGGQKKGSSNLTEAQRLDVRSEIAACAGASVGNVSKVKELMRTAVPELLQALRNGEISIHRAWLWSKESPEKQREALGLHQGKRAIRTEMRSLVRRHRPQRLSPVLSSLFRQLSALDSSKFGPVSVVLIKAPVRAVFLTEELFHELDQQEELIPTCATSSR